MLKLEIPKKRSHFDKNDRNWISDKLQSSRFVCQDPSGHPESMFEVQKLQNWLEYAITGLQHFQKRSLKSRPSAPIGDFLQGAWPVEAHEDLAARIGRRDVAMQMASVYERMTM